MIKQFKHNLFNYFLIILVIAYILVPFKIVFSPLIENVFLFLIFGLAIFKFWKNKNTNPINNNYKVIRYIVMTILLFNVLGTFHIFDPSYFLSNLFHSSIKIIIFIFISFTIRNNNDKFFRSFIFGNTILSILFLFNKVCNFKLMNIYNVNYLSLLLLFSIFAILFVFKNNSTLNQRMFFLIQFVLQIIAFVFTAHIFNLILIFTILIGYLTYLLPINKKHAKCAKIVKPAIFLSVCFLCLIILFFNISTHKTLIKNSSHISTLYASGELIILNPVFGIGSNNYFRKIINLDKGLYYYTPFKNTIYNSNSTFVFLAVENGLIVLILITLMFVFLAYLFTLIFFNKKEKNSFINLVIFLGIACSLFFNNVLNYNGHIFLLIIFISILILQSSFKINHKSLSKNMCFINAFYVSFTTFILTCLFFVLCFFKILDHKYRPIMENTRTQYINNINNKIISIKKNYDDYCNLKKCDLQIKNNHLSILKDYKKNLLFYVETKNSRYYKSRPFVDMYNHLEDLETVSKNFTKNSIKVFFEITLPFQIDNYSKDKVLLPYYGYTAHNADHISENLYLVYYIDKGFHYSPLVAIRHAKTLLEEKKYDEFKTLHKLINDLMEIKSYNRAYYKSAIYYFNFNNYEPGWNSGMTQGVILDISAEAYYATKDPYYYNFIKDILPAFKIDYMDGGIIYNDPKTKYPFLLEYAYNSTDRELNGSIIGAFGLRKWYLLSGNKDALKLYKQFIQEILLTLPNYDYPEANLPSNASWSKYSLTVFPVQKAYHELHIHLLYNLSKDELITDLEKHENIEYYLTRWTNAYIYKYPKDDISKLYKSIF